MLTESDCKLLTVYLGECYHIYNGTAWVCQNKGCNAHAPKDKNRTFTTIQDFYDLKVKMVEQGEWASYSKFCGKIFAADGHPCICDFCDEYINWLIHPDRCQTVAEWLSKEGK